MNNEKKQNQLHLPPLEEISKGKGAWGFRGIFFFCLFTVSFPLHAQLLWKIEGKGLSKPSYLFGTHHLIPVSFLDKVPNVFQAFNESETVIGEVVMYNIEASEKIMQAAMLPQGITMENLLTADDWAFVDMELKTTMKMGLRELGLMHPTMINVLYMKELYKKTAEFTENVSIDSYFQTLAMRKDKKVVGLETIDQQIEALFGSNNLQHEADLLVKIIRRRDEAITNIKEVDRLYKAGKIEKLVEMAKNQNSPVGMSDEEYMRITDNRNRAWAKILPDLIHASPSFIAVGALHLGGENGLINLLRQQGFKVTAVKRRP